jgi:hypothetical protein
MLKKLEHSWGFHPRHFGSPPNAITPREGNNSTIHIAQGRSGGTGTVPSFKACVLFILYCDKRNSTEPKKENYFLIKSDLFPTCYRL